MIPHIMVDDAAATIVFYRRAFGTEDFRIDAPGGGMLHAEVTIGRSALMLGDANVDEAKAGAFAAPASLGGGTSVTLHVSSLTGAGGSITSFASGTWPWPPWSMIAKRF
ncbi:glyoxalase/bleomycin resistance/extradiol dioxygenase family protein [Streptomyces sp. V1I6]|uniref:VOC family protein n=1 Tax=Streptomyces sp. V1I6 TaxID=3042273 RepID=UPI002786CEE3|nr:hypothetical protein [Streptomyces sp. V1I6]MDQ0847963.1 putative glyoxalase superfamily protein PhnB [Streptomyces sp. V1I6]